MKHTIELEFNSNDFAWVMEGNKPTKVEVVGWRADIHGVSYEVTLPNYQNPVTYYDHQIYSTKEQLLNSL